MWCWCTSKSCFYVRKKPFKPFIFWNTYFFIFMGQLNSNTKCHQIQCFKKGPMKLSCLWDPKAFSAHEFFYRKMYTVSIQKWWKTANFYCSEKTFCSLLIVWFLIFPLNQVNVNQSLPKNWDLTHRLLCDKVFIYWFEYISAFKRLDIKVKI